MIIFLIIFISIFISIPLLLIILLELYLRKVVNKKIKNKNKINKGEKIIVDRGVLGLDTGILLSVDGFSIGGNYGTYLSDLDRKEHIFDQVVHKITKL